MQGAEVAAGGGPRAHLNEDVQGQAPLAAVLQGGDEAAARHHVGVHTPLLHALEELQTHPMVTCQREIQLP